MKISRKFVASLAFAAVSMVAVEASAQTQPPLAGGFAIVSSSGALLKSVNVTNVQHTSTGKYQVTFNHEIKLCAINATLQAHPGSQMPGFVVVGKIPSSTAYMSTFNADASPADFKFSLAVSC